MHNWKAKKLLALLLSIVMVLGLLPVSALAADTTETAAAPITVTAGGKACTLEQIENESYLIYRAVFYPEQDITITPADENNNVTLRSLSSMLIYDRAGNAMENLDSATLPADMIEQNKMDADQLASLPGYVEVENTQYASVITVDVKDSEDAVVAQAVLYLVTVEAPAVVPVDTLELSQNELTLTVGDTATLTATVGPENATDKTVTWSVNSEAVTVNNGTVTAVKAGTAIVTATSGSATASCKVTVEEAVVETDMVINNAADLKSFAAKVSAGNTTINGIVKADIDLSSDTEFFGIGTADHPYAGDFDGGDHTITLKLSIKWNDANADDCMGLIAYAGGARIHNVVLAGSLAVENSAGLVGCTVSGETTIENCINNAAMTGKDHPIGGILGDAKAQVSILNCVNNGTIGPSSLSSTAKSGSGRGGIVGALNAENCVVESCVNHGEMVCLTIGGYSSGYGGIVGSLAGKGSRVTKCYNDAKITGYLVVGGIAASAGDGTTIESCYNAGDLMIRQINGYKQGLGGILGVSGGDSSDVTVQDVYNVGKITALEGYGGSSAAGVGGIVAYIRNSAEITNAYNAGTVTVGGATVHGSVLGYAYKNTCKVSNCYWLEGTDDAMFSGKYVAITGVDTPASTSDALKALYTALGDGFKQDAGTVNSGYPVLEWQVSEAPDPVITGIKITHAPDKTEYTAGEDFDPTGMTVVAVYDNGNEVKITDFTVEDGKSLTAGTTKVTVKYGDFTAEQTITVTEAASGDYELRVLTFEDADYKGGTNFAGGNDWTSLIDNPQYGGTMLYPGGSGTTDVSKAYTWTDLNNTELTHTLPKSWDNYCYWGGGHAISHYNSSDFVAHGSYDYQLTVYNKNASAGVDVTGGGHNGSNNFAVHFGYKDNSGYTDSQILPSFSFVDAVERVVDHMYVNNTTYALNCYLNGNGLTAKIGPDDWVKLTATGYNAAGEKTGDASIYLVNGPEHIITDWTKFDLSGLGKVLKVEFNITGSSDNGHGFSQPAYFAYDDVAVRFEKTPTTGLLGDVNNDGDITLGDAVLLYAYVRGKTDLTADQLSRCDLNNDGTVSLGDAVLLYAYVRGKITSFTQN